MRRLVPWLIGITVAAIAIVAAVDAIRGGGRPGTGSATTSTPTTAEPVLPGLDVDAAETLRRGGATGELVYTDAGCQSTRIALPKLSSEPLGISLDCPPGPASRAWTALPRQTSVIVPPPCLLVDPPPPQGCNAVALTPGDVRAAIGASGRISIEEIAWLGGLRLAAIVRDHDRNLDLVAIFEGKTLVESPALAAAELSGFGVSPLRRHLAVRSGTGGIFVLDLEGHLTLPARFRFPLLETRAVAWSPDDTWTALATRSRLFLLETDPATTDVIDLPVSAIGLVWD